MVETSSRYKGRKLDAGLKFIIPFVDRITSRETIREKVLDIPPQLCITRDNLAITCRCCSLLVDDRYRKSLLQSR
ncbi:SPFH domain-containing protein [Dapis sp. BLCC M229]|uniref:SPFH domain-containing protein n=1 Tax=Dapis sp. BLCC M229 TaxID=3400188 RepID=UPI003CF37066